MKGETKKLIKWAEEHFNHYQIEICTKPDKYGLGPKGVEQEDRFIMDFVNFLHTLPEIESKLCHGGYIQDKNGTPCCHGDIVKFEFEDKAYEENWKRKYQKVIKGRLDFSTETKNFVILFGKDNNGYDWIDWTTSDYGCKWFEKVER